MLTIIYLFFAGILYTISLSNPELFFLTWIAFLAVLATLNNSNLKESFYRGWILGTVVMIGSAYWLYFPLHDFSGLSNIIIIILLLLLYILMGIFYALWALIFKYINGKKEIHPLLFAASWTAFEFIRFKIVPVYPLAFTAYTQTGFRSLLQFADIGGMFFISFITALISAYIYKFIKNKKFKYIIPVIIIIILILSYGIYQFKQYEAKEYKTIAVGIINTMVDQKDKWKSAWIEKNIDEIISSAVEFKNVELIISPETSLTFDIIRNEYYRDQFLKKAEDIDTYLQIGTQSIKENEDGKYNSVFLISPAGEIVNRYNKRLLVPFGEYIPFHNTFDILSTLNLKSLNKGEDEILFTNSSTGWVTAICSEIMYPLIYNSNFEFIVNHSNEAWYRESNLKPQMWSAAVFRAIEYRSSVVKSGNHSWSGYISPSGKHSNISKNGEDIAVNIKINKENTLYQQSKNFISWGALIIVVLGILIRLYINRRN